MLARGLDGRFCNEIKDDRVARASPALPEPLVQHAPGDGQSRGDGSTPLLFMAVANDCLRLHWSGGVRWHQVAPVGGTPSGGTGRRRPCRALNAVDEPGSHDEQFTQLLLEIAQSGTPSTRLRAVVRGTRVLVSPKICLAHERPCGDKDGYYWPGRCRGSSTACSCPRGTAGGPCRAGQDLSRMAMSASLRQADLSAVELDDWWHWSRRIDELRKR